MEQSITCSVCSETKLESEFHKDNQKKSGRSSWCKDCVRNKNGSTPRSEYRGLKHKDWIGDKVRYQGVHDWIRKLLGTPSRCSSCFSEDPTKRYEWANISNRYYRRVNDWMRLCKQCHVNYDKISFGVMFMEEFQKLVSLDSILAWYREKIESKQPIPPSIWLDGAAKLEVLVEELDEDLVEAKMAVNEEKASLVREGNSVAAADALVEATPAFRTYLTLKAKKERVVEFIRLAKKRTELSTWDR